MKKNLIIHSVFFVAYIFLLQNKTMAQDLHFSQFSETPLLRNPALAGIFTGDLRVQAVFRNQWSSVTVPFQTCSLNGEYKIPVGNSDDFLTLGGAILYDKAGTIALTETDVLPVFNYNKSLSEERNMYLSAGFSAGFVQKRFDPSKMTTNNQFDGMDYNSSLGTGENFAQNNYLYFDGSAGLSFNAQIGDNIDNNIYLGAAYHHVNRSAKVSFYNSPDVQVNPKWVFSGGLRLGVSDYAYTTFYGDYSIQGPYSEAIGGVLYTVKLDDVDDPMYTISGGAFLRWTDAFVPVVKLETNPLTFALSYDINMSELKTASLSRGGFELSVSYKKFIDRDHSASDAVRCPRF
jgi:type IX secretion system PorP/SprF family membrane protein